MFLWSTTAQHLEQQRGGAGGHNSCHSDQQLENVDDRPKQMNLSGSAEGSEEGSGQKHGKGGGGHEKKIGERQEEDATALGHKGEEVGGAGQVAEGYLSVYSLQ